MTDYIRTQGGSTREGDGTPRVQRVFADGKNTHRAFWNKRRGNPWKTAVLGTLGFVMMLVAYCLYHHA